MDSKFNEKQTATELVKIYVSKNPDHNMSIAHIIDIYKQTREVVRQQEEIHNSLELSSHE